MTTVIAIKKHDRDSLNANNPILIAVAKDKTAAMQWIQDEVDHKHPESGTSYMQGKSVGWWVEYGTFSLTTMEVQGS
jgi:hypothetical protein